MPRERPKPPWDEDAFVDATTQQPVEDAPDLKDWETTWSKEDEVPATSPNDDHLPDIETGEGAAWDEEDAWFKKSIEADLDEAKQTYFKAGYEQGEKDTVDAHPRWCSRPQHDTDYLLHMIWALTALLAIGTVCFTVYATAAL